MLGICSILQLQISIPVRCVFPKHTSSIRGPKKYLTIVYFTRDANNEIKFDQNTIKFIGILQLDIDKL